MLAAGVFAGGINTVVGSGTLVTFPVLLAIGYPPVVANVSNTVGLVPGSVSGRDRLPRTSSPASARACSGSARFLLGGLAGAVLLLTLPESAFEAIVPVLIAIALVLVVLQPRLSRMVAERRRHGAPPHGGPLLWTGIFGTGVYGGYFGAAQGIILLALMGIAIPDEDLQRLNALKNVLAALVNGVAAVLFIVVADVAWGAGAPARGGLRSSVGSSAPGSAGGSPRRCCAA